MNNSNPLRELPRLHSLDALRAILMLLGICIHAAITYTTPQNPVWPFKDRYTSSSLDILVFFIHSFRMPLFFVLAGFFGRFLHQRAGTRAFVRHRIRRIWVPFVVGLAVLYIPTYFGFFYVLEAYGKSLVEAFRLSWERNYYGTDVGTMHLWFLYYLVHMYVGQIVLAAAIPALVGPRVRNAMDAAFARLIHAPWRALVFAVPTVATLYCMDTGGLDTTPGFLIAPATLLSYGIFYACGWLLFGHLDLFTILERGAWGQFTLAMLLLPVNLYYTIKTAEFFPAYHPEFHTPAILTGSVLVWLFIFAFLGLAHRYGNGGSQRMRYLADASYWMYLVHLPVALWLQIVAVPWATPALVKFTIVSTATGAITLATYHLFVRQTFIGETLNGARPRTATH